MVKPTELSFKTLCDFFTATAKAPRHKKIKLLKSLMEKNIERGTEEAYEVYRLILPQKDRYRGNYDLKETKLVQVLCKACSLDPKVNEAAKKASDWRNPTTINCGNFPAVMFQYLFLPNCGKHEGTEGERELKIGMLNQKLDELVAASGDEKVKVLQWLIRHTSPTLMQWVVHLILKDMKLGISESTVFKEYHPDAESSFAVDMDLKKVITTLRDKHLRVRKQEIQPGNPAQSQLAKAVPSPKEAHKFMKGKTFLVETKFDGERMQVHRDGDKLFYYSRRAIDHGEQSGYKMFDSVMKQQIKEERVVLDGEIVCWNKTHTRFEPFGGVKSAFRAASEGKPGHTRLSMKDFSGSLNTADPDYEDPTVADVEIFYIAFDVLYHRDQSVNDKPLQERHAILDTLVADAPAEGVQLGSSAMQGRVVPLMPQRPFNGIRWSTLGSTVKDIEDIYEASCSRSEEGIVIKALDSPWKMNDRSSTSWLKMKPDYVYGLDIDTVIIGGHYGTRKRAGCIAEYLLALAEKPRVPGDKPSTFISFCKVGTGVDDKRRVAIHEALSPLFIKADKQRCTAPKCYRVTGSSDERPDVWISDPYKSIVLKICADVRLISSKTFATHYSLRFPRCIGIRDDKDAASIQTQEDLSDMIEQRKDGTGEALSPFNKKKKAGPRKAGLPGKPALVSSAFEAVDVSDVQVWSDILNGAKVNVISYGTGRKSRSEVAKLIAELGGKVILNMSPIVTHYLTEDPKHWEVKLRVKRNYDVLTLDWLMEVADAGRLIQPRPKHYVYLSRETATQNPNMDQYTEDCDLEDLKALLDRHVRPEDRTPQMLAPWGRSVEYTATEAILDLEAEMIAEGINPPITSLFRGCRVCVVLAKSEPEVNPPGGGSIAELQDIIAERLRLSVQLCAGQVSQVVEEDATHLLLLDKLEGGPAIQPRDLLQMLMDTPDGGIASLENLYAGLSTGKLKIVDKSWVEVSYDRAMNAPKGSLLKRDADDDHLHDIVSAVEPSFKAWPWDEFGGCTKTKPSKASKSTAAGRGTARKRGRPTAGEKPVRRAPQKRVKRGTFKIGPKKESDAAEPFPDASDEQTEAEEEEVEVKPPPRRRRLQKHSTVAMEVDKDSEPATKETTEDATRGSMRAAATRQVGEDKAVQPASNDAVEKNEEVDGSDPGKPTSMGKPPKISPLRKVFGSRMPASQAPPEETAAEQMREEEPSLVNRLLAAQMAGFDDEYSHSEVPQSSAPFSTAEHGQTDNLGRQNSSRPSLLAAQLAGDDRHRPSGSVPPTDENLGRIETEAAKSDIGGRASALAAPQPQSSQMSPSKKLSLRERMAGLQRQKG